MIWAMHVCNLAPASGVDIMMPADRSVWALGIHFLQQPIASIGKVDDHVAFEKRPFVKDRLCPGSPAILLRYQLA